MKAKNAHVNGWGAIEQLLERNQKNQSWLAHELKMSNAAVTQVKQGIFQLSGEKLAQICRITCATQAEKDALYSEVVNARLFGSSAKARVTVK